MLADMAIGIETARLAVQRSAWEVDQVSGFAGPLTKRCVLTRRRLVFAACLFLIGSPGAPQRSLRVYRTEGIRLIVWISRGILRTNIEINYRFH